jgi:hypothetical protein
MPLEVPINADNRRYMTVKAVRAGNPFDHLTASLARSVLAKLGRVVQFEPYARPITRLSV